MLRFLVFFALLLAPAASAGVSTSTDILPESTDSCEESGYSYSDYTSHDGNGSWYYRSYGYYRQDSSCSSTSDVVRANATSNGHEAASLRYGYDRESAYGQGQSYHGESWGTYGDNESSSYSYWSYGDATYRSANREGGGASVSTFAGDVGTFDGCSNAHEGGTSHSQAGSSRGDGGHYSYGAYSSDWSETEWRCERTATAETGVTTVRAGEESPCRVDSRSFSNEEYRSYNGSSGSSNASYDSYESACSDEHFVAAGSERASVGTRNECDGARFEGYSSESGETRGYEHQSCESRTGAFGPDGLAVYVGDVQGYHNWCAAGDECSVESYAYRHLGVEHDLVGAIRLPLA